MDLLQEVEGYTCEEVETSFVLLGTNIMFVTFHVFMTWFRQKIFFLGFLVFGFWLFVWIFRERRPRG